MLSALKQQFWSWAHRCVIPVMPSTPARLQQMACVHIDNARQFGEPQVARRVDPMHPAFKAVLVDAAGTLLIPSEPAAQVYLRYASKYGVTLSEQEVLHRFRKAYNTPWGRSHIRYVGDGRPFWYGELLLSSVYAAYQMQDRYPTPPHKGNTLWLNPPVATTQSCLSRCTAIMRMQMRGRLHQTPDRLCSACGTPISSWRW